MERNPALMSLLGFITVAFIEAGIFLALIATVFKKQGFDLSHAMGIVLIVISAITTIWAAWLTAQIKEASAFQALLPQRIGHLTTLSFLGSIGSIGLLTLSIV